MFRNFVRYLMLTIVLPFGALAPNDEFVQKFRRP
jgi:hypothetical protein